MVAGSHCPFLLTSTWLPGGRSLGPKTGSELDGSAGGWAGTHAPASETVGRKAAPKSGRVRRECRTMGVHDTGALKSAWPESTSIGARFSTADAQRGCPM